MADGTSDNASSGLTEEQYAALASVANQLAVELLSKDTDSNGKLTAAELEDAFLQLLAAALGASTTTITNTVLNQLDTSVNTDVPSISSKYGTTFKAIKQGSTSLDLSLIDSKFTACDKKFSNIQIMFDSLPKLYTQIGHKHFASAIVSGVFDVARIPNLSGEKITSGTLSRPLKTTGEITKYHETANLDADIDYSTGNYNGISSNVDQNISIKDKDQTIVSQLFSRVQPSGNVQTWLRAHNVKPNGGGDVYTNLTLIAGKDGTKTFQLGDDVFAKYNGNGSKSFKFGDITENISADTTPVVTYSIGGHAKEFYKGVTVIPQYAGIQFGTEQITTSDAYGDDITFTFSTESPKFTLAPIVICTLQINQSITETHSKNLAGLSAIVQSVSKTQCVVRVHNELKVKDLTVNVNIVAIARADDPLNWN